MFRWNIQSSSFAVRENVEKIHERVIQAIWNYLFLRVADLRTVKGDSVQILDQGTWNHDAGPDFLNAKLRIGETVCIGHVEMHHQTSDWKRHGHDGDRRYDDVILHVVMDHDGVDDARPVLEMRSFLIDRLENLVERLRDLEQQNIFCHDGIGGVDDVIVQTWVRDNGWQRFLRKAEDYRMEHDRLGRSWESMIYEGVCEALGYSANRPPFRRLAQLVPLDRLRYDWPDDSAARLMRLQAVLLGVAGLLDEEAGRSEDGDLIPFINRLQTVWSSHAGAFKRTMKPSDWKLSRMRPANFPTLRIAGLARFLMTHGSDLIAPFDAAISSSGDSISAWKKAMHLLHVSSFGYWSRHYRWNDSGQRGAQDLIGVQRASEILINVVLPVLYSRGSAANQDRIRETLHALPTSENNRLIRDMVQQLRLRRKTLSLVEGQGLIQLHRRCKEMQCADCPVFDDLVGDD